MSGDGRENVLSQALTESVSEYVEGGSLLDLELVNDDE